MRYQLVTEKLIHLLQRPALRLGKEENVRQHCNDVENEEDVKVPESDICQCLRRNLRKDEVHCPIRKCGDRVPEGTAFDRKNFRRVHPGDYPQWRVEEAEDEVHSYHGAKLIAVTRIQILRLSSIND